MDMRWDGVQFSTVVALARPLPEATAAMLHSPTPSRAPRCRWSTAGPPESITPRLYAWKGAKWNSRIELMTVDRPGHWEQRGYSNSAVPWLDDRYS